LNFMPAACSERPFHQTYASAAGLRASPPPQVDSLNKSRLHTNAAHDAQKTPANNKQALQLQHCLGR
jgi:hypothetical protein